LCQRHIELVLVAAAGGAEKCFFGGVGSFPKTLNHKNAGKRLTKKAFFFAIVSLIPTWGHEGCARVVEWNRPP